MLVRAAGIALLLSQPALAQSFSFGAGGGDGSSATVTTQQALPTFEGPFVSATVLSGVNVRSAPTSHGSTVIGTLEAGDVVSVRCHFGWCELANNGGYAAEKFLSLEGTAQSFEVVEPPAEGAQSTGDAPPVTTSVDTAEVPPVAANFDGLWTVLDPDGKPGMPLILKQSDRSVTGTLQSPNRLTKITGEIEGSKLTFTYQMLNEKGGNVAAGNGFFNLQGGGQSLSGVLMLNGLVITNIKATR
ncbi:MAG TPA: SH3 domain-containing protein [Devosia sp.]|nr:SH3 domain-containing protein [Devosia sp.]